MVALKKAVGTVREASRYRVRVPLSDVLIRDGEPYFILREVDRNEGLLLNR